MDINEYVEKIEINRHGLNLTLINGKTMFLNDDLSKFSLLNEIENIKKNVSTTL